MMKNWLEVKLKNLSIFNEFYQNYRASLLSARTAMWSTQWFWPKRKMRIILRIKITLQKWNCKNDVAKMTLQNDVAFATLLSFLLQKHMWWTFCKLWCFLFQITCKCWHKHHDAVINLQLFDSLFSLFFQFRQRLFNMFIKLNSKI